MPKIVGEARANGVLQCRQEAVADGILVGRREGIQQGRAENTLQAWMACVKKEDLRAYCKVG